MSLTEIRNVVLLFSNPVWSGANTVPSTIIRNITGLSSQIAYEERITSNLTTLTTTNAETLDGTIQGLLYVPEISDPECNAQQYDFLPGNVTHREDLPPANYNLVAIAPWFSIDCTRAYLDSASFDPIRAFIFYKPNNSSNKPQDSDSPVWNLEDNDAWKKKNKFPIFAISGRQGHKMVKQLSLYSGDIADIPHGEEINDLYGPNPKDYVRIWTELKMENDTNIPALWAFFLIIIGALLIIITSVSCTMHLIQRRHRKSLKRRVESGEVDLEAMGIKRLTVPVAHIRSFPLFTYNAEPDAISAPPTPNSSANPLTPRSSRPSRAGRRPDQRSVLSTNSMRRKRSSLGGTGDTTATNDQPNCQICLVPFEHRVTIIRELPCGHIFHTECIDEFLAQNSSLCPMCKNCMLPRGYCPRITNGMVRRERALRRLRERVDVDTFSLESGDTKMKIWGRRLFRHYSSSSSPASAIPLTVIPAPKPPQGPPEDAPRPTDDQGGSTRPTSASSSQDQTTEIQPPAPSRAPRSRRFKPRALSLLPTQPENSVLSTAPTQGRKSPSSFARERMRQIAARNAPFDDPDQQRAKWRRALSKVFPGYY